MWQKNDGAVNSDENAASSDESSAGRVEDLMGDAYQDRFLSAPEGSIEEISADALGLSEDEMSSIKQLFEKGVICKSDTQVDINAPFADDRVIVVVKVDSNKTSYWLEDFADIGCTKVKAAFSLYLKEKDESAIMLVLTLDKHSKENVIDKIKVLSQRTEVFSAHVVTIAEE